MNEQEEKRARAMRAMSRDVLAVVDVAEDLITLVDVALTAPDRYGVGTPAWHWRNLQQLRGLLLAITHPDTGPRPVAENEINAVTRMLIAAGLEEAPPPDEPEPVEPEPATEPELVEIPRRSRWRRSA